MTAETPSREQRAAYLARYMVTYFDQKPRLAVRRAAAAWGTNLADVWRLVATGAGSLGVPTGPVYRAVPGGREE